MKQQQEPEQKLTDAEVLSVCTGITNALNEQVDTADTDVAPDTAGVPLAVAVQQKEAVKLYGAQISGMLAPTLEALDELEQKINHLKWVIVERERLLLTAASENSVFAQTACEHTAIIGAAVEQLAAEIEASVPRLPLAKAA